MATPPHRGRACANARLTYEAWRPPDRRRPALSRQRLPRLTSSAHASVRPPESSPPPRRRTGQLRPGPRSPPRRRPRLAQGLTLLLEPSHTRGAAALILVRRRRARSTSAGPAWPSYAALARRPRALGVVADRPAGAHEPGRRHDELPAYGGLVMARCISFVPHPLAQANQLSTKPANSVHLRRRLDPLRQPEEVRSADPLGAQARRALLPHGSSLAARRAGKLTLISSPPRG